MDGDFRFGVWLALCAVAISHAACAAAGPINAAPVTEVRDNTGPQRAVAEHTAAQDAETDPVFTGEFKLAVPPAQTLTRDEVQTLLVLIPELARLQGQDAASMTRHILMQVPAPGQSWASKPSFITALLNRSDDASRALVERHGLDPDTIKAKVRALAEAYRAWRPDAFIREKARTAELEKYSLDYDRGHQRQLFKFEHLRRHGNGIAVKPLLDAVKGAFDRAIEQFDQASPEVVRNPWRCSRALIEVSSGVVYALGKAGRLDVNVVYAFNQLNALCWTGRVTLAEIRALLPSGRSADTLSADDAIDALNDGVALRDRKRANP